MKQEYTGIAVFDFDGTITDRDSFLAFIRFTHGSIALYWGLFLHLHYVLRYFLGQYPNDLLKERIFSYFYGGETEQALRRKGQAFCLQEVPKFIFAGAQQRLDWHKSERHRIIILSASSDIWLAPWCQANGFELIATRFQVVDGRFTGQIAGQNCYGEEKSRRIAPIIQANPTEHTYGYGDRKSDQHFLSLCKHSLLSPLSTGLLSQLYALTKRACSPLLYRLLLFCYGLLFFSLPFSLPLHLGSAEIEIPTEPLMVFTSLLLLLWHYRSGLWPKSFYRHPLSLAGFCLLLWMFISLFFSTNHLVSLKYFFITAMHWWVFYHGIGLIFDRRLFSLLRPLQYYMISFACIILYAWTVHAQYDFRIDVSVLSARPFYFDHALYSSCMLLLLGGLTTGLYYLVTAPLKNKIALGLFAVFVLILSIGIYLSFSRAAWISFLLSSIIITAIYILRLQFRQILLAFALSLIGLFFAIPAVISHSTNNTTESKTGSNWDQIASITNVTTDVSNLERINRYSCAWRMFLDRPVFGFGTGTFQFAYLDYQRPEEMTRISVTQAGHHRAGKGGGAHSEYFQLLAETGLPGLIFWVILILSTCWAALHVYYQASASWQRQLSLALLFSLLTYFTHALFNNFLHHGKFAALFWSTLAILVWLRKD